MPNFDAGHYFLTVLAPVRSDPLVIDGQSHSRRHLIKEVLALMPTGERTVQSQGTAPDNPFARTTSTHFARFVVLDDVVFNGRVSGDALWSRLTGVDPLMPRKVDRLSTPFLIFVADFDAANGSDATLQAYAEGLWQSMRPELLAIFQHCIGFDSVTGPDAFFRYLKKCQIETTMPFNDYWAPTPALNSFDFTPYLLGGGAALAVFIVTLFTGPFWLGLVALFGIALAVFTAIRGVMAAGQAPFPTSAAPAPVSTLPTVLKALRLQRQFTAFAIDAQNLRLQPDADLALHEAFAAFLAREKPADVNDPTQRPGIIGV